MEVYLAKLPAWQKNLTQEVDILNWNNPICNLNEKGGMLGVRVHYITLLHGQNFWYLMSVVNRPGVAKAVLQTPVLLTHSFTDWLLSSRSSKHQNSQSKGAKNLKFWENVHPTPCVMCHMSRFTDIYIFLF